MADQLSASEALYGFMGWLTTLEKPVTFSARHNAALAAELVNEYCQANGLDGPREDWTDRLKVPTTRQSYDASTDPDPIQPVPVDPDQGRT